MKAAGEGRYTLSMAEESVGPQAGSKDGGGASLVGPQEFDVRGLWLMCWVPGAMP